MYTSVKSVAARDDAPKEQLNESKEGTVEKEEHAARLCPE